MSQTQSILAVVVFVAVTATVEVELIGGDGGSGNGNTRCSGVVVMVKFREVAEVVVVIAVGDR